MRFVVATEHNAWIHAALTLLAIALGLVLDITRFEWCAIVFAIGLVWATECFNTALECLADAAVPELHAKVGAAKDASAGAVLVSAVAAAVIGALVFVPHVLAWVSAV